ncbi:MAG: EamA family transporter [Ignavibacteria bacterium]|nr:EamA family transporter [Ignavibacteria bacterium]MBK8381107.1 EamA family transporter [Ignavibacteria bacterium]
MKKFLLVFFLTFTAAFTPIAAKVAVAAISPLSLAFLRFGVATLLLLTVFLIKKNNFRIEKKDYKLFLFLGALVIPINQICFLEGVKLSAASHSGILYASTPLIIYLISVKLKNEIFSLRKLLFISLTIAGIAVIFYENITAVKTSGFGILTGDILLFFAVASWSVYLAFSSNMVAKYGALKTQTLTFLIGILMYIPVFLFDLKNLSFERVDGYVILSYLHLTFLVAFGSYFLYSYSTKIIKTSTLTTLTNMSPVITILFSWLLLKENLSYFFIMGAAITMTGVFLTQRIKDEPSGKSVKENLQLNED